MKPLRNASAALLVTAMALAAGGACAKLPPPSPEAQQKAAEAAARAAWNERVAQYKLCQVQDQLAAEHRRRAGQASHSGGRADLPACGDPGPFSLTPPEQKPLEAAGAHSPPGTAASPPNTAVPQAAGPADGKSARTGAKAGSQDPPPTR